MLTAFWVRLVTEDLPNDDTESWRMSVVTALRGNRDGLFVEIRGTNIDPVKRRAVIVLTVQARTGSGAVEMLNEVLPRMGAHPELFAIRRLYLYPVEETEQALQEQFDDLFESFGPEQWKRIGEVL